MEGSHNTLKYKIESDNLDAQNFSDHYLYLKIYNTGLSFGICDTSNSEIIYYEKHQFGLCENVDELIEQLKNVWDGHEVLNVSSWSSIKVLISSSEFSYIPSDLFEPKLALGYLNLNCEVDEAKHDISIFVDSFTKTTCCFTIHNTLKDWFKSLYPSVDIEFIHATTAFTNGVLQDINTLSKVCVNVQDDLLSITFNKNQELMFINVYNFITDEDFVYYILLVYEELKLNPSQTPLIIWGIDEKAQKVTKLKNYISSITTGHFPKNANYSSKFEELPQQYEFDLFNTPSLINQ